MNYINYVGNEVGFVCGLSAIVVAGLFVFGRFLVRRHEIKSMRKIELQAEREVAAENRAKAKQHLLDIAIATDLQLIKSKKDSSKKIKQPSPKPKKPKKKS